MKKTTLSFISVLLLSTSIFAQHVREQDITYSRYIVREINLRHSNNQKVFGKNCMLSVILLDALKEKNTKAYHFEDRTKLITYKEVEEKLMIPSFCEDSSTTASYRMDELYVLELTERLIFDKNTSEFRFIPMELTLFIPAEISSKGIMEPVAVFPFEECTRIFRNDPRAFAAATKIGQPVVNFNEQFVFRSYVSTISKIGNENDLYFDQQYNDPYKAFMAMKQEEQMLQEMMYAAYHPK